MNPPNIWIIGDLQGCCSSLRDLLAHPDIAGDPDARFWFAGDLVNRGPNSLGTLKTIIGLGERAIAVLGNHDLHLLAVAAGVKAPGKGDTITDILQDPQSDELINWLRHRPLVHYAHGHLMVHAGLLAQWDLKKTLSVAAEVESALRGHDWKRHLENMYGNKPVRWKNDFRGDKRLRVIINALTRIRMCNSQGHMDFEHKNEPDADGNLMPWFDVPNRATRDITVVFGHWSTLGLFIRSDVICLDTGCVWGGKLTAMRLHDHKIVQVACVGYQNPLKY